MICWKGHRKKITYLDRKLIESESIQKSNKDITTIYKNTVIALFKENAVLRREIEQRDDMLDMFMDNIPITRKQYILLQSLKELRAKSIISEGSADAEFTKSGKVIVGKMIEFEKLDVPEIMSQRMIKAEIGDNFE